MAKISFWIFFRIFVLMVGSQLALSMSPTQELDVLKKLPPTGYDKRIRPLNRNPLLIQALTPVRIKLHITNIENVDDTNMEIKIKGTLIEKWNDNRLNYTVSGRLSESESVTVENVNDFWKPDVGWFSSARNIHVSPSPYMIISGNGDVELRSGFRVTFECSMNLRKYPFDEQVCPVSISSERNPNRVVQLIWDTTVQGEQPVTASSKNMNLFTLVGTEFATKNQEPLPGASNTCLQTRLTLRRNLRYYGVHIYIPTAMAVILSWTSFWLPVTAITARVMIGLSTLLTMAMQVSHFNARIPATPYTKAIDVWTGICLTFAFVAFLEFCTVNYLRKKEDDQGAEEGIGVTPADPEDGTGKDTKQNGNKMMTMVKNTFPPIPKGTPRGDVISCVVFPSAFLFFVAVYFVWFLCIAGNEEAAPGSCE